MPKLTTLFPLFSKRCSKNCLACIYAPWGYFLSVSGAFCFNVQCANSNKNFCEPVFKFSRNKFFLCLCMILVYTLTLGTLILVMDESIRKIEYMDIHSFDSTMVMMVSQVPIGLSALRNSWKRLSYIQYCDLIWRSSFLLEMTDLMGEKDRQALLRFNKITFASNIFYLALLIVAISTTVNSVESFLFSTVFLYAVYAQLHIITLLVLEMKITYNMIKNCYKRIQFYLTLRKQYFNLGHNQRPVTSCSIFLADMKYNINCKDISKYLKNYRLLYMSLVNWMKHFQVYDPLLWTFYCILLQIASIHIFFGGNLTRQELIFNIWKMSLATCCTVYLIKQCQNISDLSGDILSSLFKYPVTKLTPGEAAQVEMLITTLTLKKPVIKPFDVFTVGTALLAPMIGTVMTYVLVVLQFRISY